MDQNAMISCAYDVIGHFEKPKKSVNWIRFLWILEIMKNNVGWGYYEVFDVALSAFAVFNEKQLFHMVIQAHTENDVLYFIQML